MIPREQEKGGKFARAKINLNAAKPLYQTINLTLTMEK